MQFTRGFFLQELCDFGIAVAISYPYIQYEFHLCGYGIVLLATMDLRNRQLDLS